MKVRGYGFASLHTVEEALELLSDNIPSPTRTEKIHTTHALGRKIVEPIHATRDQPGFRRAAMDGFAIKVEDTYGASDTSPVQLQIIGSVEIGETNTPEITRGEVLRISTGAPLPDSATGVIKIEDTEVRGDIVEIYASITEGKNIAKKDEDLQQGQLVLPKNTVLKPWDIGMLMSLSLTEVEVYCKPQIATLSTGNELVSAGQEINRGQVVDSNRPAINSWVATLGGEVVTTASCNDQIDMIKDQLEKMASVSDLIITSGGTSVGSKDYLAEIIEEMGEIWVHGIAIRPGKPVVLGQISNDNGVTPIIALPGYPLAAFLNFHLFVSFILERWTGNKGFLSEKTTVKLLDKVASKAGTRDYVRLKQSEDGAEVIRISGAGILSSLVKADYLLAIPTDLEGYNAGEEVEVFILR